MRFKSNHSQTEPIQNNPYFNTQEKRLGKKPGNTRHGTIKQGAVKTGLKNAQIDLNCRIEQDVQSYQ